MGRVTSVRTGAVRPLRPEHLVGRSRTCDLRLDERLVSSVHAALRWTGHRWELRDLGSRNGTFLDGRRIGEDAPIGPGETFAFGAPGEAWHLVDPGPPRPFAESDDLGFVEGTGELLALPHEDEPVATIYRGAAGWTLERDDGTRAVADRDEIEAGARWRLHLPASSPDRTDTARFTADLDEVSLRIAVSRHEEHVEVELAHRAGVVQVGAYAANELLLALARARLEDTGSEGDRGWVDVDELARAVRQSPACVRQWIYLTRKRFEELGLERGSRIVERRPGTREVRLGVAQVRVEPL